MQSHTEESSTSTSSIVVSSTPPLVDDIYTQVVKANLGLGSFSLSSSNGDVVKIQ
ncbi:hypothetical protein CK203_041446 [Vitis vinifera]|uniref:Uncharacterized protein n=1 Tax=Vitis vinifera TaxID=29760 RepID=A0A438DC36_VITVI|nr:hypothetical protein CK203_101242 [Vitis vinifera]RVW86037.1 hypothetical protein CK203_041446 [Vitis vinifera]